MRIIFGIGLIIIALFGAIVTYVFLAFGLAAGREPGGRAILWPGGIAGTITAAALAAGVWLLTH